jgi:hypothetical protein
VEFSPNFAMFALLKIYLFSGYHQNFFWDILLQKFLPVMVPNNGRYQGTGYLTNRSEK